MNNYEIVECQKCDNRFISYDHQDEHIVCKHCDNKDRMETAFLSYDTFNECDCNQCEQIKKEVANNEILYSSKTSD